MDFLRIIYWSVAYTAGIMCLTFLFLAWVRTRAKVELQLIKFWLTMNLVVISLSVLESSAFDGPISRIASSAAIVGAALSTITFPSFAVSLNPIPSRMRISRYVSMYGVCLIVLDIVDYFMTWSLQLPIRALNIASVCAAVLLGLVWIIHFQKVNGSKNNRLWTKILLLIFPLVMVFDLARSIFQFLPEWGEYYVTFPAYYLLISIQIMVNYAFPRLFSPIVTTEAIIAVTPGDMATKLQQYKISEREIEVLGLLIKGLTYLEIADTLCISHATVKTHISHLYQKTNTKNKVMLLSLLNPHQPNG